MPQIDCRHLIQTSAILGFSAATVAKIVRLILAAEDKPLAVGARILFQGDSIIDANRDRKADKPNDSNGHALMASEWRKVTGI